MEDLKTIASAAPNEIPASLIRRHMQEADDETCANLPKRAALKRVNNRVQAKQHPPAPMSFADIREVPPKYSSWLLRDTRDCSITDHQLIFCSADGLKALQLSTYWVCDGTFKVAPRFACQLYTIHTRLGTDASAITFAPAVFSLMQKKTKTAYEDLFTALKEALPHDHPGPEYISSDYEHAAILAYQKVFPNAAPAGCLFHLSQILYRRLQASGVQSDYNRKESTKLRDDFHRLIALAFVPEEDVKEVFDDLCKNAHMKLQLVLKHMQEYYVHGRVVGKKKRKVPPLFPIPTWNCFNCILAGLPRTTNTCEM